MLADVLYRLKQRHSVAVWLFKPTTDTVNHQTGVITKDYSVTYIRRAILLPKKHFHSTFYLAMTHKHGGYIDTDSRLFLIDYNDVDEDITLSHHIQYDNKRWEIERISKMEEDQAFMIHVTSVANVPLVIARTGEDGIPLSDTIVVTVA